MLAFSSTGWSKSAETKKSALMSPKTFAGLKLRGIGPALLSGRISDIAIHPKDQSIWYVAAGSGSALDSWTRRSPLEEKIGR